MRFGRWIAALTILLALGLAGCPNSKPAQQPTSTSAAESGHHFRAALVLDTGGVDDKSFNAAAWAGLQRAQKELGMAPDDIKYVESQNQTDYKTNLTNLANQGYDIVIAVGLNLEDTLKEVAPQFPNVKFGIVDGSVPDGMPNATALKFREEQGTFLAGFLAASVSKTKRIGFVGGMSIPLIQKFDAGYRAGAKTAGFNPETQCVSAYTGDWGDLSKGESQAQQEFGNGADIVFAAAGKAGLGVLQAASRKGPGFYAIGVDQDQDDEYPGRVLTSMVKHVDTAVFDTVKRTKEGKFEAGTHVYDLKSGGVGLSEMKNTKQDVPPAVLAKLAKLTQMVSDGTVVPPTTLADVAKFQPPKL